MRFERIGRNQLLNSVRIRRKRKIMRNQEPDGLRASVPASPPSFIRNRHLGRLTDFRQPRL